MLIELIDMNEFPVRPVLDVLLSDKTTGKNIKDVANDWADKAGKKSNKDDDDDD